MKMDTTKSTLQFISGENDHVCRFCFISTVNNGFHLLKLIDHDLEFCTESVNFYDMLYEFGVRFDELPQELCIDCAQNVITSYLFKKKCENSAKIWEKYINRFENCILQSETLSPQTKSLFIFLNETSVVYSSKKQKSVWTKEEVLKEINNTKRNEQDEKIKLQAKDHLCAVCGKRLVSKFKLAKHIRLHKDSNNYLCNTCGRKFKSRVGLSAHIQRIHYEKTIKCNKCSNMFSTLRALKQHKKVKHEVVKCKICLVELVSRIALRSHLDTHESFQCPLCHKNYRSKVSYKFHLTICGKEKPEPSFFCDLCKKGYARKNNLRTHLKIEHGFGKVLSCEWCGKKFDAISLLKSHIVKHTREKNFHCEICGGRYVTHAALVYHTRLHTGEKPFPCDLCNESFLSSSRRTEHKNRKHMEPRYKCDVCAQKFVTRSQLRTHAERHYNPDSKLFVGKRNVYR